MTTTRKPAAKSSPLKNRKRQSGPSAINRGAWLRNIALAFVFGVCVFLASIGPARERQQGSMARAQYENDVTLSYSLRRLKDPAVGYLNRQESDFSNRVQSPITPWGARTRAEGLPFGVGFFIEHAFSSKEACAAYVELAMESNDFDRILVDGVLAHAKNAPLDDSANPGSSLCSSTAQNAIRLIARDPGAEQVKPRQAIDLPLAQDSPIAGGYLTPKAAAASAEQLREAERLKAASDPSPAGP